VHAAQLRELQIQTQQSILLDHRGEADAWWMSQAKAELIPLFTPRLARPIGNGKGDINSQGGANSAARVVLGHQPRGVEDGSRPKKCQSG
jgi:hypothetical protein